MKLVREPGREKKAQGNGVQITFILVRSSQVNKVNNDLLKANTYS